MVQTLLSRACEETFSSVPLHRSSLFFLQTSSLQLALLLLMWHPMTFQLTLTPVFNHCLLAACPETRLSAQPVHNLSLFYLFFSYPSYVNMILEIN